MGLLITIVEDTMFLGNAKEENVLGITLHVQVILMTYVCTK